MSLSLAAVYSPAAVVLAVVIAGAIALCVGWILAFLVQMWVMP